MDIFTQRRFTVSVIVVLVILNIGTMALLWFREAHRPGPPPHTAPAPHEQSGSASMLKQELGLSDEQFERYDELRQRNRNEAGKITREMSALKRQLFDHLFEPEMDTVEVERIIQELAGKEEALERVTFAHLKDLKDLCGEGQQEKLRKLLDEFSRATGGGPQGPGDRPQPGERPPERP